jgi:hypothetical protein
MSATDQALKTSYTLPVPQFYNPATGVWEEATGTAANGAYVQSRDGAHVAIGATGDAAATSATAASSVVGLLKAILKQWLGTVTLSDKSVTITGAAQTPAAANASRKYLLIQAPDSNASDVWISLVGTAQANTKGSVQIKKGGGFEWSSPGRVPGGALSVIGTVSDVLTVWEG